MLWYVAVAQPRVHAVRGRVRELETVCEAHAAAALVAHLTHVSRASLAQSAVDPPPGVIESVQAWLDTWSSQQEPGLRFVTKLHQPAGLEHDDGNAAADGQANPRPKDRGRQDHDTASELPRLHSHVDVSGKLVYNDTVPGAEHRCSQATGQRSPTEWYLINCLVQRLASCNGRAQQPSGDGHRLPLASDDCAPQQPQGNPCIQPVLGGAPTGECLADIVHDHFRRGAGSGSAAADLGTVPSFRPPLLIGFFSGS